MQIKLAMLVRIGVILSSGMMLAATASAAGPDLPGLLSGWLGHFSVDVHAPQACDQCEDEKCVVRQPIEKCVKGKKEVFDCLKKYEYVSIPETRYRWVKRWVTEERTCPYCMPVCESKDGTHCYETENWAVRKLSDKEGAEVHCKECQTRQETLPCKHCGRRKGETTVRVKYLSCVKEPYTVYRRVRQEVCVKRPSTEKVDVVVTAYRCHHCADGGCSHCSDPGKGENK